MNTLPELDFFSRLLDDPRNELVDRALGEGRVPIGYNCYLIPEPLLSVGKAFPVRLRAPQTSSTEQATFYQSPFICSYARSLLECALDGGYDFLGGLIFVASCTHITRVAQNAGLLGIDADKPGYISFIMDAPRKIFEPQILLMIEKARAVTRLLTDNYGIDTGDDALRASIRAHNEFNSVMRDISDMRKEDDIRISGTEFHTLQIATRVAPRDMLLEPLKKLKMALAARKPLAADKPRVMVVGSILDNPAFTELFESQGCVVVADRYCFGALPGLEPIPEEGDPVENMVRHQLATCMCPRMMEMHNDRINHALSQYRNFRADGVIFETMKFCDLWGYEILTFESAMKDAGIPLVRIEREYPLTGEGQMRTRVQAFIESIKHKRLSATLNARMHEVRQ